MATGGFASPSFPGTPPTGKVIVQAPGIHASSHVRSVDVVHGGPSLHQSSQVTGQSTSLPSDNTIHSAAGETDASSKHHNHTTARLKSQGDASPFSNRGGQPTRGFRASATSCCTVCKCSKSTQKSRIKQIFSSHAPVLNARINNRPPPPPNRKKSDSSPNNAEFQIPWSRDQAKTNPNATLPLRRRCRPCPSHAVVRHGACSNCARQIATANPARLPTASSQREGRRTSLHRLNTGYAMLPNAHKMRMVTQKCLQRNEGVFS
jgi:hypothetical protein